MEPTHVMVHLRVRDDAPPDAIAGMRDAALTCGCAESEAFDIAGSAPSPDLADATHTLWQVWYSEGLYRQWRDDLTTPNGVEILGYLELATASDA